jgi:hypothetical protein
MMIVAGMLSSAGAQAIVINVDGDLADWGIQKNIGAAGWLPTLNSGIHYTIEDQNTSYLDPGYGGQAYDAEAIYALIEGNQLFIALATGHNPNTANTPSANHYGAGDFAIDFGKNGTYELGINVKPAGWDTFGVAGGVYQNATWALGLWNAAGAYDPSHPEIKNPTSMTAGGTYLGLADLRYTTTAQTGYGQWSTAPHYFYEMSVGLDLLTAAGWDGSAFNIHWTQNCANDSIIVDPPSVPEPGTLALLPLGLLGLAALRRRKTA